MRKTLFTICMLFFLALGHSSAQDKLPFPVTTPDYFVSSALMFPDSSVLVHSASGKNVGITRFVFKDNKWQPEQNHLTEMLNSLIPDEDSHLHFRPSVRCDRLIVTLHRNKGKTQKYLESTLGDGQWSHFREILKDVDHAYNNGPLSYSLDGQKLYSWSRRPPLHEFTIYTLQEGEWKNPTVVKNLNQFNSIHCVIGVTEDGVLIHGVHTGAKKVGYYFTKMLGNGEWSAPLRIREFSNSLLDLSLTPFMNTFIATDFVDGGVYLIKAPSILAQEIAQSRNNKPVVLPATNVSSVSVPAESALSGKYYALLIGNADYNMNKLDLNHPVKDVNTLKKTLARYNFDEANLITLVNASRNQILQELYRLRNQLTSKDNLLIFYAGHGYWDEKIQQGYWWPVDALPDNPANWLSNSDLREQIRGMNTRHTLLVSDACFSGGIFRTRGVEEIRKASLDIQLLYRMPSRRAITSGTLSSVPDNSVFFRYFIKYLDENQQKFVASGDLFTAIRTSVLNNSLTVPQDGVIMDTGDEGGDFVFIKGEQ